MSRLNRVPVLEKPKLNKEISTSNALPTWMIERKEMVKEGIKIGIQGMQWMTELELKDEIERRRDEQIEQKY